MQDLAAGTYRLPWEDSVQITDGTLCGIALPDEMFQKTAE